MIKVIAFDYADVVSPAPLSKWVRENLEPTDEKYLHYKNHSRKWDIGEMTLDEVYEVIGNVSGTPKHLIWESFYENLEADPGVIATIKKLKPNYKVFLFSNFHGGLLRKLLARQKIENLFDQIIISSEHKLAKPDPEFFKILINKAGVRNKEILFTDDRIENIEGAKSLGINTIHFIGSGQLLKDLRNFGIDI